MAANWSYPDAELVLTVEQAKDRDLWLATRREGVGGSDMAALFGEGRWEDSTEYDLWLDKTGRREELVSSAAMKWGTRLENEVAQDYAEQSGLAIRRVGLLRSKEHPRVFANCDRLTDDGGGLEVKTGNFFIGKKLLALPENEIPRSWWWQGATCIFVTGRSHWYFAGLFGGQIEWTGVIHRSDPEVQEALERIAATAPAWYERHVVSDEPPELGAPEDLTPLEQGDQVEAAIPVAAWALSHEWRQLRKQAKDIDSRIDEIKAEFEVELGGHKILTASRVPLVRMQERIGNNVFKKPDFVMAHPDIDIDSFYKRNKTSRFPVLIGKDDE